jgi:1,4-alpha-glucan branching enzyme
MIDLSAVGAHTQQLSENHWQVRFGLYLPEIRPAKGYALKVRIIHEIDQFVRSIEPVNHDMTWLADSDHDLWQANVNITPLAGTHYGQEGRYLYRYQLLKHQHPIVTWFSDPFAREAGPGTLSVFRLDSNESPFQWSDSNFRVPHIDDMVVYELHVDEFNETFKGIEKQLDYLHSLGVNVLELMPFTNVKEESEWGYTPLGYFAPDDRYGGKQGLKQLVDNCHSKGFAVILDAVYAHAHVGFAYNLVYTASAEANPMMGHFAGEFFSNPGVDYHRSFARDYFLTLNHYWIDEYHLDGFRYDYVPGMLDGPVGDGYAYLTYHTYQHSKGISRFQDPEGFSRIIQCAEHLPDPKGILRDTYSNCSWQNILMDKAFDTAHWRYIDQYFAFMLDPELIGYPSLHSNAVDRFPVAPFQYIETHDNPRFLARIAKTAVKDLIGEPLGDRSQFYRLQPYVIALYTGKGIPMLWQGQEFGENYGMPSWGLGRNLFERPVHWEYFYDDYGKALVRLYRIMGSLRRTHRALSSRGDFYYYNETDHLNKQVVAYRRSVPAEGSKPREEIMVLVNFSDSTQGIWVEFPSNGVWTEQIDKGEAGSHPDIVVNHDGDWIEIEIPSYYGLLFTLRNL